MQKELMKECTELNQDNLKAIEPPQYVPPGPIKPIKPKLNETVPNEPDALKPPYETYEIGPNRPSQYVPPGFKPISMEEWTTLNQDKLKAIIQSLLNETVPNEPDSPIGPNRP